ncbi:Na+/phosphate symporter [Undibacterium sp. GrIS 1.8]
MNSFKRIVITTGLLWVLLFLFIFIGFVIMTSAPWLQVKLPLITMGLGGVGVSLHLLSQHYPR